MIMFFCKSCVKAKMSNVFTKGKSASLPRKVYMNKHNRSKDHID